MRSLQLRFGTTIRRLRVAAGYSQEGFADEIGVHRSYMGMIERGKVAVTLVTMHKLARGLNMTMSDLLSQAEREH
ncbi:hypothetical protein BH09GEM1_BH09GEM1_42550 [soil metagenome]